MYRHIPSLQKDIHSSLGRAWPEDRCGFRDVWTTGCGGHRVAKDNWSFNFQAHHDEWSNNKEQQYKRKGIIPNKKNFYLLRLFSSKDCVLAAAPAVGIFISFFLERKINWQWSFLLKWRLVRKNVIHFEHTYVLQIMFTRQNKELFFKQSAFLTSQLSEKKTTIKMSIILTGAFLT